MRWLPVLLFAALPAQAAVFEVTKTSDTQDGVCDRDCSLREAVSAANQDENSGDADVVVVPAGIYRLTRTGAGEDANQTGDLDLNDRMILVGAGPGGTVLSGEGADRVLDVRATVEVYGVTVRDGRVDGDGGGILVRPSFTSQLLLHRSVVTANQAGGDGGGIAALAILEVRDSAILENRARLNGGGIGAGQGSLSLTNVTVSGNRADGSGGGLDYAIERVGTISGSTIVFNQAGVSGGGTAARPPLSAGEWEHVLGSIVAENTAPLHPDCDGLISAGYNVLGPGCHGSGSPTDRTGAIGQVVLRLPSTDLGPTPVHELLLNSPALDLVPELFCEPGDQVGQARRIPCDAGAWEKVDRPLCVPGGPILCLQNGRFRVSASHGSQIPAVAQPLTDDTGNYWLFSPENLEVMVKVLNGCGVNQRWWVFSSGLTNVGVTLQVEDLETGRTWVNIQPPGQTYSPRLDTAAFPCALTQADEAPVPGEPGPATAVLVVSKTADTFDAVCDHDCSLRDAVFASNLMNGVGVIVLGPGVYELGIQGTGEDDGQTGDLDVTGDLVILGAGADRTVLDARDIDRVLEVQESGNLELRDAAVRNGSPPEPSAGGGIQALGPLTLVRTLVTENSSDAGGGIFAFDDLTMRDSTVSNNESLGSGGGIEARKADLENVTVSGNLAAGTGGGVFLGDSGSSLRQVTVTGNRAVVAGGLAVSPFECPFPFCSVSFTFEGMVIAGNRDLNGPSDCEDLPVYGGGFNVFGVGPGCNPGPEDRAGTVGQPLDPKLSPLGDHGGPTPTHVPLPDSPAIDLVPSCSGADQRGRPRPSGDGCDAGAVELLPGCQPDAETLCLGEAGRFRVTARWTAQGNSGAGMSLPLAQDTGSFWFFDSANVELTVKVLNGCGVNQRYWVFLSGLTNVGVELRVEDTKTSADWTHNHAAGAPLQPRLDTDALEVCP